MDNERAISLPFSFNSAGEVSYTEDLKKIIQDRVVLAVMTKLDERVMRPDFGSDVYSSLFETQQVAENIVRQAITSTFSTWFPYLSLKTVKVSLIDEVLEFTIFYTKGVGNQIESVDIKTSLLTRAGELIREISNGR